MADHIDIVVGATIKRLRRQKKLTQTELGEHIGVSFQQVQKYETGRNRVSASCLVKIARTLNVSVADLFAGVEIGDDASGQGRSGKSKVYDVEATMLMQNFQALQNSDARRAVIELSQSLVGLRA